MKSYMFKFLVFLIAFSFALNGCKKKTAVTTCNTQLDTVLEKYEAYETSKTESNCNALKTALQNFTSSCTNSDIPIGADLPATTIDGLNAYITGTLKDCIPCIPSKVDPCD